jgi:tetratricopeptide (TPR) repeat protein
VREFALERLAASGEEEEIRRRHLAFYLQVAQGAEGELTGPDQLDWLARLAAEHDNIRAALTFALDRGDGESALQICSGVIRFWEYHGHLAEGRRMLDAALEQGTEAPPLLRMKALNRAGILAGEQGDFDAAERHFIASLELARELGNAERAAAATGNLGNLAMFRGDYERARELLEEGREIWLALGEDAQAAIVVEALGLLALLREDLDEAESLLEEALAAARRAQHAHSIASILHLLGRVLLARGNADRAAALVDDALVLVRDLHEPRLTADCLETAAGLAAVGGDAPSAAVLFGAAHGLRTSIAGIRPPDQQPWYDRYLELARAALDPEQFEAAFARGQTLALDDAVAAALGTGAAAA